MTCQSVPQIIKAPIVSQASYQEDDRDHATDFLQQPEQASYSDPELNFKDMDLHR